MPASLFAPVQTSLVTNTCDRLTLIQQVFMSANMLGLFVFREDQVDAYFLVLWARKFILLY